MRTEKIFNESGKGYWMEGFGCLRAEGENRPSRPGHVICYAIEGNVVDRVSAKNGKGWCEDVSPTLNTQDRHAVVYALEGNGARPSHMGKGFSDDGVMYTLNTIEQHSVCYGLSRACYTGGETSTGGMPIEKDISPTIMARGPGCVCYDARGYGEGEVAPAVTGDHNRRVSDYSALVVYSVENHPCDGRTTLIDDNVVQTLRARMGTGGGNVPLVLLANSSGDGIAAPLDASYYKGQGQRQGIERGVRNDSMECGKRTAASGPAHGRQRHT